MKTWNLNDISAETLHRMADDLKSRGLTALIDNGDQIPAAFDLLAQAVRFVADHKDRTVETDSDW